MDTPEITTQPEPESGLRRGLMTGRAYDPVVKKDRPPVEIKVTVLPHDDDSTGPVARRAVPRPAPSEAKADSAVSALIAGTKADPNEDARRLAEAKESLKPTIALAKSIVKDVEAFAAEHREFLNSVQQIDTARYIAFSRHNDAMVLRVKHLHHALEESLRTINNVPVVLDKIPAKVAALHVADLRLTVGRDPDQTVMVGVSAIEQTVRGMAGIRARLDENLATIKRCLDELHQQAEANGWLKATPEGTTFTEVVTPAMQDQRERLRPTPAVSHAVNSIDENGRPSSDWNPLDYTPRRS